MSIEASEFSQITVEYSDQDGTCICNINAPEPTGFEYGPHYKDAQKALANVVGSAFLYRKTAESDRDCPYNGGHDSEVLATGAAIAFSRMPYLSSREENCPVKFHPHETVEGAFTATVNNLPWVTLRRKYKPSSIENSHSDDYVHDFGPSIYALTGVSPETENSFAVGSVMPDVNGRPGPIKGGF